MSTNNSLPSVSSEQLMLDKMQQMQQRTQADFIVKPNLMQVDATNTQFAASPLSFSQAMTGVLNTVNQHQKIASDKVTAVELGKSDDLVGAMVASQKASLSFSALMQVRNKVVASFEDVMKMPV
ncbi:MULTISPECIES: flagellar hook-basal body complex protein FliE [unclassified Photobacterium]|uniref:flagellar hook-basal body complex protein FliE n=1 Tax=unclassified Photobacterium TaxID=2628852 RepID=UPI000D151AEA|nr:MULTISPECIES: flagellar hook-basal body complex protein FliE [unclassified Photobacterium]PSV26239.1 flagellar hook-basal body complex protein FliE [Photobacterium sp. GB-56]PSV26811.1 flagellar hook-basal body complex protein FliE [Photobacterium sp. GB-72]PSV34339.1 flagellar hook-basal body complex protein FliE [Photobacterium sp. GB-210]PSV38221.1 flagellar hook-basal body complex protein FliE [Photobacterium sp. GB-27]PSV45082.1 flagellar hook-basal body complex protein FliE [Photobact